jgi:glyoxylase-like metal-dependent hydrolase (beta-lactamase superfamily II)
MAEAEIRVDNPGLRTPQNGWFRFHIGEVEATIVSDGRMLPHDIAAFFPGLPPADLVAAKARAGVQGTHFSMEQNCLVLRYPGHVVLFDTGVGTDPVYGWQHSGLLLRSMAAAGIAPGEVTEVVLTHAHSDHAWGLVDAAGLPNFPQARVIVPRVDFEHWTDLAKVATGGFTADFVLGARRALLAYPDRLTLFEAEGEVLPGVRAVSSPGHSPGHCSYIIGAGPKACLFLGDVVHTVHLQMAHPGWAFAYDYDPVQAAQTRQALLTRVAAEGLNVIGYHFDFPGLGRVHEDGAGFRFKAANL